MQTALLKTDLPFPVRRGKVRDVYDLGDVLLIVATDRISAFDCIMPNGIPDKGRILTALSLFWFDHFAGEFENHLIATDVDAYPTDLHPYRQQLAGRSMLVKKAKVVPIECVARGYLAGSGWKEYQQSQTVCGIPLPSGLRQCDKLPHAIFTPATKEQSGHDINISFDRAAAEVGQEIAGQLRDRTLALYAQAAEYARGRGIIIADSKFEFGMVERSESRGQRSGNAPPASSLTSDLQPLTSNLILIDEILTPDSSRFWPADKYAPGRDQESFDKQFVRNWLETQPWNKTPPAPTLPEEVVQGTRQRYLEAYERLTGKSFAA